MWDTASSRAERALLGGWAVFASVNVVLMWFFPGGETIPFHFVWISLALVFGLRPLTRRTMVVTLAAVTFATAIVMAHHALVGEIGLEETTEVPLMAGVFLVMVWHVNRRQEAIAVVRRLAARDRQHARNQELFMRSGSHELRTPITVARGYVELVRDAHPADEQLQEDTGVALEELEKLAELTSRLVTLAALEHPAQLHAVDLDAVLEKTVRRWSPVAEREWVAESSVGEVVADPDRLETMLDSLIENAVKFTAPGDRIALVARREGGEVVLEVSDSGVGIPAEDLPHVFDRFRSGSAAGERAGSGLGLAIARAAVEARGGTLTAHSASGAGTTFVARIPDQPPVPVS
jgi:two-component system, OmpR family, sensor kinase